MNLSAMFHCSLRQQCVYYYRCRDNRAERPVCLNRSTCRQCVCVCLSDCLSAISTYIDDVARGGNNTMYTFLNGWMVCKILSIDTTVCSKLHRDKHMPRSISHRIFSQTIILLFLFGNRKIVVRCRYCSMLGVK